MAITSADIANQSFSIDRKGYDVDEVDVFLERVADEIDLLNSRIKDLENELEEKAASAPIAAEESDESADAMAGFDAEATIEADEVDEEAAATISELRGRIKDLEERLEDKNADTSAIATAMVKAQRVADDTIKEAKSEAKTIVDDAKDEASAIVARAEDEAESIIETAVNNRSVVFEELQQLENEREASRGKYQDLLNDFAQDIQKKLEVISEVPATRVPKDFVPGIQREARAAAATRANYADEREAAVAGSTIAFDGNPSAVAQSARAFEKDLSGFGAAIDDIDFEDID